MWLIFVRNAMKISALSFFTAFTAINANCTKILCIHCISYKNSPRNLNRGSYWLFVITNQSKKEKDVRQLSAFGQKTYISHQPKRNYQKC